MMPGLLRRDPTRLLKTAQPPDMIPGHHIATSQPEQGRPVILTGRVHSGAKLIKQSWKLLANLHILRRASSRAVHPRV
jgi:hypothetical protein